MKKFAANMTADEIADSKGYRRGVSDRISNLALAANPYPETSDWHCRWVAGWHDQDIEFKCQYRIAS